jgi:hypothetical protein
MVPSKVAKANTSRGELLAIPVGLPGPAPAAAGMLTAKSAMLPFAEYKVE